MVGGGEISWGEIWREREGCVWLIDGKMEY